MSDEIQVGDTVQTRSGSQFEALGVYGDFVWVVGYLGPTTYRRDQLEKVEPKWELGFYVHVTQPLGTIYEAIYVFDDGDVILIFDELLTKKSTHARVSADVRQYHTKVEK